jgi:hypothetical protein
MKGLARREENELAGTAPSNLLLATLTAISFPDPCLTASLYCAGRIDWTIARCVLPVWRRVQTEQPAVPCYLWILRYGRGGEHLKLRFHGPSTLRPLIEFLLTDAASAQRPWLAHPSDALHTAALIASPLDEEDEVQEEWPAGSLLWTHYRRSPALFLGKPFLNDDGFVARFTSCLGCGCELLLSSFDLDNGDSLSHRRRRAMLLRALMAAVSELFREPGERIRYLTYHRDWTIRHPVLAIRGGDEKAREILERYERQVAGLSFTAMHSLRRAADEMGTEARWPVGEETAWRDALREMRRYLEALGNDPFLSPDPFVTGPLFPTVFKILHGLANQIGIDVLNEGMAYHLLLRSLSSTDLGASVRLVPDEHGIHL